MSESEQLRLDAVAIWRAGIDAVDSERLVRNCVRRTGTHLVVCGHAIPLDQLGRIAVVGAGKAGAGMAEAIETAVGNDLLDEVDKLTGWVNVPADCVRPLKRVHLHAARPAGVNEPAEEGVRGAERILEIVGRLGPEDLCLVLLSGGGSALLPAPAAGITLADKQRVTRLLMHAGAEIGELNCVRKHLSQIKGGGLASRSGAGQTIALIISDVVGDPLDVIASGPTVPDKTTPSQALRVLRKYAAQPGDVPQSVLDFLLRAARTAETGELPHSVSATVHNHVIGNNETALRAAASRAEQLGYRLRSLGSDNQGEASEVGRELARLCVEVRDRSDPVPPPACLLGGGEPVVHLSRTDEPRQGGRNQEVAVAAVAELWQDGMRQIVILSGGTDGEDGPTDAAGGIADARVLNSARQQRLDPTGFLAINNTYAFLRETTGLFKTGPTHTNVMDLRVALVAPRTMQSQNHAGSPG